MWKPVWWGLCGWSACEKTRGLHTHIIKALTLSMRCVQTHSNTLRHTHTHINKSEKRGGNHRRTNVCSQREILPSNSEEYSNGCVVSRSTYSTFYFAHKQKSQRSCFCSLKHTPNRHKPMPAGPTTDTEKKPCATVESQFVPCCCTSQTAIDGNHLGHNCFSEIDNGSFCPFYIHTEFKLICILLLRCDMTRSQIPLIHSFLRLFALKKKMHFNKRKKK